MGQLKGMPHRDEEQGQVAVAPEPKPVGNTFRASVARVVPIREEMAADDRVVTANWPLVPKVDGRSHSRAVPPRRTATSIEPVSSFHEQGKQTQSPTIQVSIGRIEVRATVAAAPVKKLQAKSSAMSLDEYLTRRSETRR